MADLTVRVFVRVGDFIDSCLFKEVRICLVYDRAFLNKDSRLTGREQYQESKKSDLIDKIFHRDKLPTACLVVKQVRSLQTELLIKLLDLFCCERAILAYRYLVHIYQGAIHPGTNNVPRSSYLHAWFS